MKERARKNIRWDRIVIVNVTCKWRRISWYYRAGHVTASSCIRGSTGLEWLPRTTVWSGGFPLVCPDATVECGQLPSKFDTCPSRSSPRAVWCSTLGTALKNGIHWTPSLEADGPSRCRLVDTGSVGRERYIRFRPQLIPYPSGWQMSYPFSSTANPLPFVRKKVISIFVRGPG